MTAEGDRVTGVMARGVGTVRDQPTRRSRASRLVAIGIFREFEILSITPLDPHVT
jgi:hypothetical protein